MKNLLILVLVAVIAGAGIWWATTKANSDISKIADTSATTVNQGTQLLGIDGLPVGESVDQNIETDEIAALPVETPSSEETGGLPVELPTEDQLIGGDAVAPTETPGEVSFTVLGGKFYYDMTEIRVKEGDTVTINFKSVDGFHDWTIDEFDAKTEAVSTDGESSVTFVADKLGSFEYYCSVGNHRAQGQVGTLIVE